MKQIFLIVSFIAVVSASVGAQELFRCVDAEGNTVLTSAPQDGMKCPARPSDEEPRRLQKSTNANLAEGCSQWNRESEDIGNEISDLEKRRLELQKEQMEQQKYQRPQQYGYSRNPRNDKMYEVNKEISMLNQKRSLIQQKMRLYKCGELNRDLTQLNQKDPAGRETRSIMNQRSPRHRTTIIIETK